MIEEQIPRKIAETGLKMKRKVKDSVFTKLFAEQGYVTELYEALSGKSAKKNPEIEVITLETVLMNGYYNDLGFVADDRFMYLVEAQSDWSPNIVLRVLFYYVRTCEEYLSRRKISVYESKVINLPKPELYIIYTGSEHLGIEQLSFAETYFSGNSPIDLRVKIIRDGHGNDIIHQYVRFTQICAEVRQEYGASWGGNQAKEIIQRCKQENILVRFLEQREKEVIGMMTTDVEYVNWMNSKWKENYQQGMEQGREQGIQLKQERVAKEMLADHMPMDLIMKYSELSEERILELKKDLEQAGEL